MDYPTLDGSDGFPARLRYVVDSYGSANALAGAIQRSEGALRKWLRGTSEPTVSDVRAICEATNTNVEWLVTGRGDPKGFGIRSPAPCNEERVPQRIARSGSAHPASRLSCNASSRTLVRVMCTPCFDEGHFSKDGQLFRSRASSTLSPIRGASIHRTRRVGIQTRRAR